jgi:predicted transcriptional regulator
MYYKVIICIGIVMGVTSVRLQPEIENPLEKLANKLDRSKNYLINQAIKEFLVRKSLEEKKWNETLEALDSVKSNRVVAEQDVNEWLDSWGKDNEIKPPEI